MLISAFPRPVFSPANAGAGAEPDARVKVQTAEGAVEGRNDGEVVAFKGIPFAKPPIGDLRWRAPQPVEPWSGVRAALEYGPDPMQKPVDTDAAPIGTTPGEDCLYLNVWKPAEAGEKRPVLVWIYGGGFVNGGSSPRTYSGHESAKKDVVFVSFNYRIGRFGFFAHPGLASESETGEQDYNFGFLDQIAALEWVKRNIAAFGGDPDNVTVVGESAGGVSTHVLLTSPLAKGLMHKAVIQSGGDGKILRATPESATASCLGFARAHGIADGDPDALAKLRALSAQEVVGDLNMLTMSDTSQQTPPVLDGRIAVDMLEVYKTGAFNRVPVMVGATSDDLFGADGPMIRGALDIAEVLTSADVPVYYYRFCYVAETLAEAGLVGAPHATEIPFFFNTAFIKYEGVATQRDLDAAELAHDYLISFVKTGNPNGGARPEWRMYRPGEISRLDFELTGGARFQRF